MKKKNVYYVVWSLVLIMALSIMGCSNKKNNDPGSGTSGSNTVLSATDSNGASGTETETSGGTNADGNSTASTGVTATDAAGNGSNGSSPTKKPTGGNNSGTSASTDKTPASATPKATIGPKPSAPDVIYVSSLITIPVKTPAPATSAPATSAPDATATASSTSSAANNGATAPTATAVPTATPTPVPTAAPTLEPGATPTATPIATAVPTATPVATATPTAVITAMPEITGAPAPTEAPDEYNGFFNSIKNNTRFYVEGEVSESGTVICYPVYKDARYEYVPFVEFVSAEDDSESLYMLEFFGTTYVFNSKPERIMLYWTSHQLHNDGYYHISKLSIVADDAYIVYEQDIQSPSLPGRGIELIGV